jgi:hypothetical protein
MNTHPPQISPIKAVERPAKAPKIKELFHDFAFHAAKKK